jgi:hypothetical protein
MISGIDSTIKYFDELLSTLEMIIPASYTEQ